MRGGGGEARMEQNKRSVKVSGHRISFHCETGADTGTNSVTSSKTRLNFDSSSAGVQKHEDFINYRLFSWKS